MGYDEEGVGEEVVNQKELKRAPVVMDIMMKCLPMNHYRILKHVLLVRNPDSVKISITLTNGVKLWIDGRLAYQKGGLHLGHN